MKEARKRIVGKIEIENETGCWEWIGAVRDNGYCRTTYKGKNWYLHRLSFAAFKGAIPEGNDVCHKCDNRKCCNPEHLFTGSRADNMADAVSKGRQAQGFMLPQTKLSRKDIVEIIARAETGEYYKNIADDFGVTRQLIGHIAIKNGIRRRNVK